MNRSTLSPESWRPAGPAEFLGDARIVTSRLSTKIDRLRAEGRMTGQKLLFLGEPGIGKSEAALALAHKLAPERCCIERVNGQSCTVDLVRSWRDAQPYRPLFGDSVKIIDELDLASPAAQSELLTFLDALPVWQHVIATTNRNLEALQPRLQTRFIQYPFAKVQAGEIAALLSRFGLTAEAAQRISIGVVGNVRAALLDAQAAIDMA